MFKKIVCVLLSTILMVQNIEFSANALSVSAESAVLIDGDTFEVLYGKNENVIDTMASTTKIMTALIVLENTDISREVLIKPEYAYVEGSSMYLRSDEVLTIEELLYGLMLMSGNDAAVALAYETTGDFDEFISLMNQKSIELGLENTSFVNPNGLDQEGHYTTAFDLAKITAYALKNEKFLEIVSSKSYKTDTRDMVNHNKLLWNEDDCIGVKTGYTMLSGRCLVSAINIDGKKLIAVTLDAPSDWADHSNIFDNYKKMYEKFNFYTKGEIYDIIDVTSGDKSETSVILQENVNLTLTFDQKKKIEISVFAPKITYAPIKAGDVYGEIVFTLENCEIFRTNLIYSDDINYEYVEPLNLFERFLDFVKNLFY